MRTLIPCLLLLMAHATALAHPIPDVPVRGEFKADRSTTIQIEVDPRCFAEDSTNTPYLKKDELDRMSKKERDELLAKAKAFVSKKVRLHFEPMDSVKLSFSYSFVEQPNATPDSDGGVPVLIIAEWKAMLPTNVTSYQLEALKPGAFGIFFLNKVAGKDQKLNVLFPGEKSYKLDLSKLEDEKQAGVDTERTGLDTFMSFIRFGFLHVIPRGLDHILFVVGLFLLSRKWRPLLLQVSVFTLAHTLSLALATLGIVSVSPSIVEPIIAISIVVIAVENIRRNEYTHWRLLLVLTFGFIHGLGFASVLSENLSGSDLFAGLLGFNIGVELGQLVVIGSVLLLTFYLSEKHHRKFVAVPGSLMIAVVALWWTVERVIG